MPIPDEPLVDVFTIIMMKVPLITYKVIYVSPRQQADGRQVMIGCENLLHITKL